MVVFMRSDECGYEEFEANSVHDAMRIVQDLLKNSIMLNDNIEREIGVKINEWEGIDE